MSKDWWGFSGAYRFSRSSPWKGFAFGPGPRFFEAGELRIAILSLLSEGPKHGYQLMKEMKERSGGAFSASAGSVYPTLQQLEDEGLVVAEMQGGRRVYQLTEEGRRELAKDAEGARRIWERAEECHDWGQHMGPETISLIGPISKLVRASMRKANSMPDERGVERVREILERARREVEEL